jgi:hypothetical protein
MSIAVMDLVWQFSGHKGASLLVLLAIADYADDDGSAFPSITALGRKARMSERNTRYVVRELIESGEVSCRLGGGSIRNAYRVNVSELEKRRGAKIAGVQTVPQVERPGQNPVETGAKSGGGGAKSGIAYKEDPSCRSTMKDPSTRAGARSKSGPAKGLLRAGESKVNPKQHGRSAALVTSPPEGAVIDHGLLARILEGLRSTLPQDEFKTWCFPIAEVWRRGGEVWLGVPNEVFAEWIQGNYRETVAAAAGVDPAPEIKFYRREK